MGEVEGIVRKITNAVGFPVGFIYGATAQNPVAGLSVADFEQRVVDTIAEVSGFHITLGGHMSTLSQTFKPTGFINKGLFGYIAIWAYDELGLPYGKLIKDLFGKAFIGYSVGGFFDPAPVAPSAANVTGFYVQNPQYPTYQSQATYSSPQVINIPVPQVFGGLTS